MDNEKMKQYLFTWADANRQTFYAIADAIWEYAELSMQEHRSSEALASMLEQNGFVVERGAAGMPTAFVATWGSGKPVLAINAEYDALPGLSQQRGGVSKNPVTPGAPGHGCGHNVFGAASIKAAIGLKEVMKKYSKAGTIKVLGAAAEELCLGKPFLGKSGYLSGIDAFLDWHPWTYNRADYDSCCAYFSVKYHFKGRTSHGNSPWNGRSTLDAAILQTHAVEMLREHIDPGCPPDAANTINFTFPDVGPEFASVVPDRTTAWYIGRFTTSEQAEDALRRVTRCAEAAAYATETEVQVEIVSATNHKIPNKSLAEVMHHNFEEIGVPQFSDAEQVFAKKLQSAIGVPETGLPTTLMPFDGGYSVLCDTSEYSWNAPYVTAWVAMAPAGIGWHNWGVASCCSGSIGHKSLDTAAKLIAATAIDILENPNILERAYEEFLQQLDGKTYRCLLPESMKPPVSLNADIMARYGGISSDTLR